MEKKLIGNFTMLSGLGHEIQFIIDTDNDFFDIYDATNDCSILHYEFASYVGFDVVHVQTFTTKTARLNKIIYNQYSYIRLGTTNEDHFEFSSTAFKPLLSTTSLGTSSNRWTDVWLSGKLNLQNSSVKDFIKLTQAQYDTLVANDQIDEDTFYFIEEE